MSKEFRDLPIGAVFVLDRSRCVKIAARVYRRVDVPSERLRIASVTTKVDQPRAQPDSYMPHDGLRVWLDEYERCVREIDIFRECGGTDINYQENLRWARDAAAARLAGYAARVLDAPKRGGNDA